MHNHNVYKYIHSCIHYGDLYSASSSLLLRSAPDPCTAKKNSFEARVECVRKNPGEQSLCQRKPIKNVLYCIFVYYTVDKLVIVIVIVNTTSYIAPLVKSHF